MRPIFYNLVNNELQLMKKTKDLTEFERRIDYASTRLRLISNWIVDSVPWIIVGITAILAPIASSAVKEIFEKIILSIGEPMGKGMFFLNMAYVISFLIAFFFLFLVRRHLFVPRTKEMKGQKPEVRPHLILFLSEIQKHTLKKYDENLIPKNLTLNNNGLNTLEDDIRLIEELKKSSHVFWPWEMSLRAIRYHVSDIDNPQLESITVICSNESLKQYNFFSKFIREYLTNTKIQLKLLTYQNQKLCLKCDHPVDKSKISGIDFESFDELSRALSKCIKYLKRDVLKASEKQIVIDFTAGQKVTSVVAATLTFNSNLKAQYVSTQSPYSLKSYDIIYGTSNIPSLT